MIGWRMRHHRRADDSRWRHGWPISVLALLLMVAEPLGLAFYASTVIDRVIGRGALAVLLLVVRLVITAIGVGAGRALWHRRPGAVPFTRLAIVLTAAGVTVTFLAPTMPHNAQPGTTVPLLAVVLAYYAAWFVYLTAINARLPA